MKLVIDLDIYFNLPSVAHKSFTDGQGSYCSYGKMGPATNDTWNTDHLDTCGPIPNMVEHLFHKMGYDTVKIAVMANQRGEFEKADKHALLVALASGLYELKASPEYQSFKKNIQARSRRLIKASQ